MYYFRASKDRGQAKHGWLESKHSFSFAHYYDPEHMGFHTLRVINDDTVAPGAGFDTHGHKNMEIISYVLEGEIEHQDSMGNRFIIPAGEVQRMSAGSGVTHSEFNHSKTQTLRFLQIWILPNTLDTKPSYEQKRIEQTGPLSALVTPNGDGGSLSIQQDASLYRLQLKQGESYTLETHKNPGYLHMIEGTSTVNHHTLQAGDALGAESETLDVLAETELTALWFDLGK